MKHTLMTVGAIKLAIVSSIALSPKIFAQDFADDFSVDSLKYEIRVDTARNNSGDYSIDGGVLTLTAENIDDPSYTEVYIASSTRSMGIAGRFDSQMTSIPEGSYTAVAVQSAIFNDTPESESASDIGDIFLNVSSLNNGNNTNLRVCLGRIDANGYSAYPLFDGINDCKEYTDNLPIPGEDFSIGFEVVEPNLVNLNLNGVQDTLEIPGTLRSPVIPGGNSRLEMHGDGKAGFVVTSITTDTGEDNLSQQLPVLGRYQLGYPTTLAAPSVVSERVQISASSTDGSSEFSNLRFTDVTDYMEATLMIDSASTLSGENTRAGVGGGIDFIFGNVTNNVAESRVGDIRATIYMDARRNGLRRLEYCLEQYEDDDGNDRTGLLENGEESCQRFPAIMEFDTPYRIAIDVDRENSKVTFKLNEESYTETLPFTVFDSANPRSRVDLGAYDGGTLLGYIDDVRNTRSALTATELAAGAEVPAAFPPTPTDEERRVDSSLDAPLNYSANINYIDDFESGTSAIGLTRFPRESTQTAIGYFNGALEIQTASENPNQSASTGIRINAPGDTIKVLASLSDRSSIQPGSSEVSFDMEVSLLNDTQDFGFNDREGDISAKIRLRLDSDGRRRIRAEISRRDENGDNNRLELFDGDDDYTFDLVPELNTPYELGISLDRVQATITFSVDDLSHTVQLPFQAFEPAERNIEFRSWFKGLSGRSVVRIHSLTVGDYVQDFTTQPPAIAPYIPAWNSRYDGVDVDYIDGRVKLSADSRITDRNADIMSQGSPQVVAADIELSSDSEIAAEGAVAVGLSSILYHDTPPADLNDRTGAVFVALRLSANGVGERFVQTCAFSSSTTNFSSSVELITGAVDAEGFACQRMATVPEFDTVYPASITLNKAAATLTYRFANEEFVYNIGTEIHPPARSFPGVRARAQDNSKVVAYLDNLAFAANPVPLAQSDFAISRDITDEVNAGSNAANAPEPTDNSNNQSNNDSSGGGGTLDHTALMLLLSSLLLLVGYRTARRR